MSAIEHGKSLTMRRPTRQVSSTPQVAAKYHSFHALNHRSTAMHSELCDHSHTPQPVRRPAMRRAPA